MADISSSYMDAIFKQVVCEESIMQFCTVFAPTNTLFQFQLTKTTLTELLQLLI